jgi:phosphopantetheine--protein transferase-like protein
MIHGMGTDITSVERIRDLYERYGNRFVERIFRPAEIKSAESKHDPAAFFASRWAAREAFLKALVMDVHKIPYRDIEVVRSPLGPVSIGLHGRAQESFLLTRAQTIHLSISHEKDYAVATVIIEA